MTDERLKELLRHAVPPAADHQPARDLWLDVENRFERTRAWSYLDLGLAAAAAVALSVFPEWFWLLTYHL